MGPLVYCQTQGTFDLLFTMKFLIFASIVVVSAFAEPESESDPLYLGPGRVVGPSYYREKPYMHSYDAVPQKTFNNYAVYPYSYNPRMLPNAYNHFYKRLFKREAEAEAEAGLQYFFTPRPVGYNRPGIWNANYIRHFSYGNFGGYQQSNGYYGYPAYNNYNGGYQNYQQRPYNYFF